MIYRKNSAVYFNKTNNKEVRDSETSLSLTSLLIFNQLHFTSVIFTTTFNHPTLAALHRVLTPNLPKVRAAPDDGAARNMPIVCTR